MKRNRNRSQSKAAEVTLMTLLAYDSSSVKDANALLRKYGKKPALNPADLEIKLTQLYMEVGDKIQLEKEMAEIHPHKDWLLKYVTPIEKQPEPIVVEAKPEPVAEIKNGCGCGNNCPCQSRKSSFDAQSSEQKTIPIKSPSPMEYMGYIGLMAVVGLTFYVMTKDKRS